MLFEKIHLEENEEILKVVRKHWFIIASELFFIFLTALFPLIVTLVVMMFPQITEFLEIPQNHLVPLITFMIAGWLVLCLMSGYMIWTNYYLDLWIITDRRIIVVDQISFFHRNVGMFRIERLQDIEVRTEGILETFLNYGTLTAQTAGHTDNNGVNGFKSSGLPDPRGLQSIIQKAMDERLQRLHTAETGIH